MTSFMDKLRYALYGESRTLSGAYAEASISAMNRATEMKNRRKK